MTSIKHYTTVNVLSDETVIYNVTLNNPVDKTDVIQARYTEVRNQPLLEKQSDYKLGLLRANIPTTAIPIFFQTEGDFNITLEHEPSGIYSDKTEIPYINISPILTGSDRPVWTINQFIQSVNAGLETAFLSLIANYEAVNGVNSWTSDATKAQNAPFITFSNNLITLYWDERSDQTLGEECYIWMSYRLGYKFQNAALVSYNSPTGRDWRYQTINLNVNRVEIDNGVDTAYSALFQTQDTATIDLWYELYKVVLTSSALHVRQEFVSVTGGEDNITSDGNNIKVPILEDFSIQLGEDLNHLSRIQFFPAGELRRIDLLSDTPLNKIDFQIFYQSEDLKLRPLFLQPGESIDLKFSFQKRF